MKYGLQLAHLDWQGLRDIAQTAEGYGFHSLYFPDHLVAEGPQRQREDIPARDPIVEASVVIEATKKIRVGHLVLANLFRHPSVTFRSLATLDEQSGGRLIAGLGTGWTETEFRMTGLPFPDITTRLRMLDEALTCIRGLARDEPFSFEGEFYKFQEAVLLPKPVQRPFPPVLLGGSGKGLLRLVAKHADALNVISGVGKEGYISMAGIGKLTDASFKQKVRFVRDEAKRLGRDGSKIEMSQTLFTVMLTDSPDASRATLESFGGMLQLPPEEMRKSPLFLIGTPEECVHELKRRQREWELSETIFAARAPDLLKRLATEVMPHV